MRDLGHVAHFKKKDVKSVEPISASIPGPSDKPSHEHHPPGIPFLVSKLELARQEMVKRHDDAAAAQAVVQLTREIERLKRQIARRFLDGGIRTSIGIVFVISANRISRSLGETSLW